MEMLFQNVPTLCNLDMTFGEKDVGMEYERSKFGMNYGVAKNVLSDEVRLTISLELVQAQ